MVKIAVTKWWLCLFLLASSLAWGADKSSGVTVSIRPLALIYEGLRPQQPVQVLLPADRDMHEYALTVKDMSHLQSAELFFWQGQENEPFLQALSQKFPGQQWVNVAGKARHAWLDRKQLPFIIDRMAAALEVSFPEEKTAIEWRRAQLKQEIEARFVYWQKQMLSLQQQPFLLGHEAFLGFVRQLGLQQAILYRSGGDHGHAQGGMKELLSAQQKIANGEIRCAFEEPDISFATLASRYPQLKRMRLEPMANSISLGEAGYIEFIDASANTIMACLQ